MTQMLVPNSFAFFDDFRNFYKRVTAVYYACRVVGRVDYYGLVFGVMAS